MEASPNPPEPPQRRSKSPPVLQTTIAVAVVVATLFTAWTPAGLFSGNISEKMALLLTPQPGEATPQAGSTPRPQLRIGIVSGHWGNDSGAVCPDGTTEADVNLRIATLVQQKLASLGYQTDLLQEFDPRLRDYAAAALVSIHNDSCLPVNDEATGFKVAAARETHDLNRASRLTACLTDRYQRTTALPFHAGSITNDMTGYHAFDEISPNTTAAIIETGFLYKDYTILTQQPDLVATGVVNGILCFVNNESVEPGAGATP